MQPDSSARSRYPKAVLVPIRWPVGGIKSYIRELLNHAAMRGYSFTVVLPDGASTQSLRAEVRNERVSWVLTADSLASLLATTSRLALTGKFSLIHAQGVTSALISVPAALARRIPMVLTAHEVFTQGQFSGRLGGLRRKVIELLLGRCKAIHAVSFDAAENIYEYMPGLRRKKDFVRVIPHGIDVHSFASAAPRSLKAELALPESGFVFGFFGRFMAPKGFRVLIDAVEMLVKARPDRKFVVVCAGSGGFIVEDRQNLEARGLDSWFRFVPPVPHLGATIKGVDAVVMPSLWEASGLLAMEVLVCGVPLIATDCVGLRETVRGSPARVARTRDAASLAECMAQELASPGPVAAARYVPDAIAAFNADQSYGKLASLYDECLRK
ncbi:MAG TPA: glycosyltransferase family 4 protein [Steroidobacteraceae bacterium]|nr:glycosyltransferase family 4 protein [Steroidobacteraceae bacterium]